MEIIPVITIIVIMLLLQRLHLVPVNIGYIIWATLHKYSESDSNIQKGLNYHGQMHTKRSENNFWFKCSKPNCQSTFPYHGLFENHMRIHNNELDKCQYCPFRYIEPLRYKEHLNKHFRIRDYKPGCKMDSKFRIVLCVLCENCEFLIFAINFKTLITSVITVVRPLQRNNV